MIHALEDSRAICLLAAAMNSLGVDLLSAQNARRRSWFPPKPPRVTTQGLLDPSYTESEIRQLLGENVIRVSKMSKQQRLE